MESESIISKKKFVYLPHTADKIVHKRTAEGWTMALYRKGRIITRYYKTNEDDQFGGMPWCIVDLEDHWLEEKT